MLFVESIYWLALNVYHEGRGEPRAGKIAIAHVTITRATKRRRSVTDIIQQPHQFSWYSDGKPDDIKDHEAFVSCLEAVATAMAQRLGGYTMDGIDHYHHKDITPDWTGPMKMVAAIGDHIFYRA